MASLAVFIVPNWLLIAAKNAARIDRTSASVIYPSEIEPPADFPTTATQEEEVIDNNININQQNEDSTSLPAANAQLLLPPVMEFIVKIHPISLTEYVAEIFSTDGLIASFVGTF